MQPPRHVALKLSVSIVLFHTPLDTLKSAMDSLRRAAECATRAGILGEMAVFVTDNSCDPVYQRSLDAVLDNWSTDQRWSFQFAAEHQNKGFGAGHNNWLQSLQSDTHLILNPDVVLSPESLREGLSRLAQSSEIALLSPKVSGADGRQEFLCKRYPSAWILFLRAFAPGLLRRRFATALEHYEMRDICGGPAEADVELASGCCMLIPTELLQVVGGFDARYFLYFEDFDLCLRLARHGRLLYFPQMEIVHFGGYAARKGLRHVWYFVRSARRFFASHGWRWI